HYSLDFFAGYRPTSPGGEAELFQPTTTEFRPWLLLIVPTVGGLLSGWIVYTLAPEAEGHGTDAAIAAYHLHQGQIRPRVPLVKIVASAVTLGTGGSGGREGPIAQIGAGFGSFLGKVLRLRPVERRILPAALASTSAYCTFAMAFGWKPLFTIPSEVSDVLTFDNPLALVLYGFLALFLVLLAMIYTRSFYGLTHLFERWRFRRHFRPAL